jgi:hypothetical protein
MWPSSAIAVAEGGRDVVTVWMTNVCLGSGDRNFGVGMSVGRWVYDPAHPPAGQPIQVEVLQPVLPLLHPFGEAAMLTDDGHVLLYGCDDVPRDQPMVEPGPCYVARAPMGAAADVSTYQFWSGEDWGGDQRLAVPMYLPPGPQERWANPPGGFSVVRDPTLGRYLMVYSPWPALTELLELRVADSPVGPWSPPTQVPLAGCGDPNGGQLLKCYAASAQPAFSVDGRIGLGYYDRAIDSPQRRGSYLITSVELTT